MNTSPTDEVVLLLKQDVLGRVKTPKGRREQLLDEFERSGSPDAQPAKRCGASLPTALQIRPGYDMAVGKIPEF